MVKLYGNSTWRDPETEQMPRYGPMYTNFQGKCLKAYDSNNCYAPKEPIKHEQMKINKKAKESLSHANTDYLSNLGIE